VLTAEAGDGAGEPIGGLEGVGGVATEEAGGVTVTCGTGAVAEGFGVDALVAGFASSSSVPIDCKSSCPELNLIVIGVLQY
jgi:hypothetical protein